MRYASVCDGIGAVHIWAKRLGWRCAWTSEIETFPAAVVEHHYGFPNLGDMTKITQEQIDERGPIDLLVGGTPCQSFSVAGLRGGLADPRGNLALRFLQLASATRAKWVIWENVPGVLSSDGGRDFGAILGGLAECGYGFAYRVLDAQYFGVAQRRRRVFVVGHLGSWQRAAAVLFERDCLCGHPAPRRQAGAKIAASLTRGADSGGKGGYAGRRREDDTNIVNALDAHMGGGAPDDNAAQARHLVPDVCGALSDGAHFGGGANGQDAYTGRIIPALICMAHGRANADVRIDGSPTLSCNHEAPIVAHALRADGFDASEDGTGRGTPIVPVDARAVKAFNWQAGGKNAMLGYGDKPTALQAKQTPALHGACGVRRLTPRECERLQGFPDDYTLIEYRGKPAADAPRYRALGNSMARPVMLWIGQRVELALTAAQAVTAE